MGNVATPNLVKFTLTDKQQKNFNLQSPQTSVLAGAFALWLATKDSDDSHPNPYLSVYNRKREIRLNGCVWNALLHYSTLHWILPSCGVADLICVSSASRHWCLP